MKSDPLSGDLFLFTNRRRTRAKVLLWDGTGLCLYQKRLERGRFAPLWRGGDEEMLEMTLSELGLFLEGSTLVGAVRLSAPPPSPEAFSPFLHETGPAEPGDGDGHRAAAAGSAAAGTGECAPLPSLGGPAGRAARSLQLEIEFLKQQLASRTEALFGDSSERRPREEQQATGERRVPRPGHGPHEQRALPIVEVVHELDKPDQVYPSCGGDLKPMAGQFEEADVIAVDETWRRLMKKGFLRPGLVRFLGDPRIPLETNGVERAPRGVAVGRKNHYGSRSERGTRVAALLYSLIESAKLCGVEPRAYLREVTQRAVRNPGTATLARELKSPEP